MFSAYGKNIRRTVIVYIRKLAYLSSVVEIHAATDEIHDKIFVFIGRSGLRTVYLYALADEQFGGVPVVYPVERKIDETAPHACVPELERTAADKYGMQPSELRRVIGDGPYFDLALYTLRFDDLAYREFQFRFPSVRRYSFFPLLRLRL